MNSDQLSLKQAFSNWWKATTELIKSLLRAIPRRPILANPTLLFSLSVIVYLLVRVIGLSDFPIYFFTDEAVQTIIAADLVRDEFFGSDGVFLPTYFENAFLYNLSLSVYAQVLPLLLFGKSVFITRLTSVIIGMTGAIAVTLTLKRAYKLDHWWAGVLVFSAIPAWFLHSRTAFETAIFVAFMAWTLYFYLRYRQDNPRFLYASIAFGGLSFYSYRGGQLILIGFAAVVFVLDFRYHIKHRRTLLGGLLLALLFSVPYIRFQLVHRDETYFHLRMLDTFLLYDIPVQEKIARFFKNYLSGIDPRFWLEPGGRELVRHYMKGHGHISPIMAPFIIIGLGLSLINLEKPQHRTTLALALVAPLGAALAGVGITRVLVFIVPAALFATVGISAVASRISSEDPSRMYSGLIFAVLVFFNSFMLWDALTNGPTWFQDYGLNGMQYGARQVFGLTEELMKEDPERTIIVSPIWANGTDILMRFFIPDGSTAYMGNADGFLERERELNDEIVFVLTAEEYQRLKADPKVADIQVLDTIELPNGRTGFYVTTFSYSDQAKSIFAEEEHERSRPRTGTVEWKGQTIAISYPYLDMGDLSQIFDGDDFTLARTHSANPAVFSFTFEEPIALEAIRLTTGSMEMQLTVNLYQKGSSDPLKYEQTYLNLPDDPTVTLEFDEIVDDVLKLQIEILSLIPGDPFKIHIRELEWITP
jgi:hypothetical protein